MSLTLTEQGVTFYMQWSSAFSIVIVTLVLYFIYKGYKHVTSNLDD